MMSGAKQAAGRSLSPGPLLLSAALLLVACGCGSGPEPLVEIEGNSFSYRGTFDRVADEQTVIWTVSGSRALVDWEGTALQGGEFMLTILDAEGTELYFGRAVSGPPPKELTATGTPGDWRIRISYTRLEGEVAVTALAVIDR